MDGGWFGLRAGRVPPGKPSWITVGQPYRTVLLLPDHRLQGKADARALTGLHERGVCRGTAEKQQRRQRRCRSRLCGFRGVVDLGEKRQALCGEIRFDPRDRGFSCVIAADADETVLRHNVFPRIAIASTMAFVV